MLPQKRILKIKTECLVSDLCDRGRNRNRAEMFAIQKSSIINVPYTAANRQLFQAAAFIKSKPSNFLCAVRDNDIP